MSGKKDAEKLMNELLGFAERMLNDYGEFHPFGGYLKNSGAMVHVGIESGSAQDKVEHLETSFRQLAHKKKAKVFGVVTNVTLPSVNGEKSDAISIFLEHQDGYCAEIFFLYELFNGLRFTDTIAQEGERRLFYQTDP